MANALGEYLRGILDEVGPEGKVAGLKEYGLALNVAVEDHSLASLGKLLDSANHEGCRQRMQRGLVSQRVDRKKATSRLHATIVEQAGQRIEALAVDDTGFIKQGDLSVGTQRQYSGTIGKVGNCQVVTTLHGVSNNEGFCLGARLYFPQSWVKDTRRRKLSKVPDEVSHLTKPHLALELIKEAIENGIPPRVVLADAGYGDSREFRQGVTELGLDYAVGISSNTLLSTASSDGLVSARSLASMAEKARSFKSRSWRKGAKGTMRVKLATFQVRCPSLDSESLESKVLWLLVEKTGNENRPYKYYLSSLPQTLSVKQLLNTVKMRWRIEMDYRDMKQHLGMDAYEGRMWDGLHNHLMIVILLQVFIALHRERFFPRSTQ